MNVERDAAARAVNQLASMLAHSVYPDELTAEIWRRTELFTRLQRVSPRTFTPADPRTRAILSVNDDLAAGRL